jgi:hypothetical protein
MRSVRGVLLVTAAWAWGISGCSAASDDPLVEDTATAQDELTRAARFVSATFGHDGANDCASRRAPCKTVQHAVDVAVAGDVVSIGAGVYDENVVVGTPVTLMGNGPRTVLRPALSAPAPCSDSALCGGAASTILLVRASGVRVTHLALDGDNPALSGLDMGGANVDARNGIATDYDSGHFDHLVVDHVGVRNVFLRGVYAAFSDGFRITHTVVHNVRGDNGSVALFNFGGSGTMADNEVYDVNDALSANHSRGTTFRRNRVRASYSGVHTDNAGDGAPAADLIENNDVRDCPPGGYGVWVFVPYVAPLVRGNTVARCSVGIAVFGNGAPVRTPFEDNRVRGDESTGSVGALVSTNLGVYGAAEASAEFRRNVLTHTATGLRVEETGGKTSSLLAECNLVENNATGVASGAADTHVHRSVIAHNTVGMDASSLASGALDATANWWGCPAGPGGAECDSTVGSVDAGSPLSWPSFCAPHSTFRELSSPFAFHEATPLSRALAVASATPAAPRASLPR